MILNTRRLARLGALAAILAYASTATADHRISPYPGTAGAYLGGGFTRVDVNDPSNLGLFGADLEDSSFVELGYVDFGEYESEFGFPGSGLQPITLEADGVTLGAELGIPLAEDLALFAKGGMVFWEANGLAGGFGLEQEGEDPFFGAGMRFRLAPNLEVTGSFERYRLDDVDVDVSTLGFALRF